MANLGCQLGWTWDEFRGASLDESVVVFLEGLTEGKTCPEGPQLLPGAIQTQRRLMEKQFCFCCRRLFIFFK